VSEPGFFNPHQRETVAAATARIVPTDHEPGACEAGVADFIDRYLSGIDFIYAKPDGSGFEELSGKRAEAWRKRIEILRRRYLDGLTALDELCRSRFGVDFVELDETRQDEALIAMERLASEAVSYGPPGEGPALQQTSAEIELEFFPLLVLHTRQGFYADPIYGGNKDHVGWRVIGFNGPSSLLDVFTGRYSALRWFAEGEEQRYLEANRGA
jgi:gluconate 2-dehydrogenase gamma chain